MPVSEYLEHPWQRIRENLGLTSVHPGDIHRVGVRRTHAKRYGVTVVRCRDDERTESQLRCRVSQALPVERLEGADRLTVRVFEILCRDEGTLVELT
jgi:hypothetical protein